MSLELNSLLMPIRVSQFQHSEVEGSYCHDALGHQGGLILGGLGRLLVIAPMQSFTHQAKEPVAPPFHQSESS